ncbi:uncharacterized protein LOC127806125 isoform X2 [Diospyros lotus]|uniref:uncharacterized protein LOC127806125 isoform X2 n=1 Tax=Diospyros lotus TaxID=55363 RepID=UPI00225827DF|nr:uncharacterized protein LOC127806125 isoform X2 [Diospyros lotus]
MNIIISLNFGQFLHKLVVVREEQIRSLQALGFTKSQRSAHNYNSSLLRFDCCCEGVRELQFDCCCGSAGSSNRPFPLFKMWRCFCDISDQG